MYVIFAFAIALLLAVYLSGLARNSPISTSVFFLIAGFMIGPGALGLIQFHPNDPFISQFIEIALVTVLFSDGMEIDTGELRSTWKLASRALLLGLPITMIIMAFLAYMISGIPLLQAFLFAAVLAPTDPVFASQLVTRPSIPDKLRHVINIESGLNDGLALPLVLTMLTLLGNSQVQPIVWIGELVLGVGLGVSITWIALRLVELLNIPIAETYYPLMMISIGVLVYALSSLLNGNVFLAAFSSGITAATISPKYSRSYHTIGTSFSELLKLASLLIFGSLLSVKFFAGITIFHLILAILVLVVARPLALIVAFFNSALTWKERLTAGWFGPRGFASVIYGLLVFRSAPPEAALLFELIALVIIVSIVLHSSTDFLAARWLGEKEEGG